MEVLNMADTLSKKTTYDKRKEYFKEYARKKYAKDAEFKEKQKELSKQYHKEHYHQDEEYKQKRIENAKKQIEKQKTIIKAKLDKLAKLEAIFNGQ